MDISVIGSGYVGMVTGMGLCDLGFNVIFVDVDNDKIEMINSKKPPIYEEGLEELMEKNSSRFRATSDYDDAINNTELTLICVGTPSRGDGSMDMKYIEESSRSIAGVLRDKKEYHAVVVKSTVLPGTTEDIVAEVIEDISGKKRGVDFGLAMNPEFLKEGVALKDFFEGDRIVIGGEDEKSLDMVSSLYSDLDIPIYTCGIKVAEMIKYTSNSFLAMKISFANEIGNYCKELGMDSRKVFKGVGMDSRISPKFFGSGIGFGGSCFPKDVNALLHDFRKRGMESSLLSGTMEVNEEQPLRLVRMAEDYFGDLSGKTIGVLGLAFKPNTDDIRYTRALPIVRELLKKGAKVKAFDPLAQENFSRIVEGVDYKESGEDVMDSDAVMIVTEWDEFRDLDYRGKVVFDGRRLGEARDAKYYEGICW